MRVPFNDLHRGFALYREEYERKAIEVLNSGRYILSDEVLMFENEFKDMLGSKHCIGVDNGLNAIQMGIRALGIGHGDEVIVQSNTYIATVMGISMNGALPVFVEPDEYYNMDPLKIEEKISKKTKAVLVTHLYGQPSRMDTIRDICWKHRLHLLEDCAQSHMASYDGQNTGTFGTMGFFSFYPTKNLGGFGDGGAVTTNDEEIGARLRVLRNYGSNRKYHNEIVGYNSRLDELQAGLLRVKLPRLDSLNRERTDIAERYLKQIHNVHVTLPKVQNKSSHVWHLFVVRLQNRNHFRAFMEQHGVSTDVHYPIPPHLSKAYKDLGFGPGSYPIAEQYANTVVSLPIFNGMRNEEITRVIEVVNQYGN